jgi:hypothetical protein
MSFYMPCFIKAMFPYPPQFDPITWYTDALRQIQYTLVTYPEPYMFNEDVVTMVTLVGDAGQAALSLETVFSTETLKDAFEILDKAFVVSDARSGMLKFNIKKYGVDRYIEACNTLACTNNTFLSKNKDLHIIEK